MPCDLDNRQQTTTTCHTTQYMAQPQTFIFMAHNSQGNNREVIHEFGRWRDFRSGHIGHSNHIVASILQQSSHTLPQHFILFLQTFHPLSILLKVDQHRQWHALHNISVDRVEGVCACHEGKDAPPLFLNLGKWLASIPPPKLLYHWGKSPQYPLTMRLGGP